jgi:hypothetical protein
MIIQSPAEHATEFYNRRSAIRYPMLMPDSEAQLQVPKQ